MKNVSILIFVLFTNLVLCQNYIFSFETRKPIESANISYGSYGLISNEDGYFELPKDVKVDSIILSHLGYQSKRLLFSKIKQNDTIYLQETSISLDEVVLNSFNAKDTLLKAIERIKFNYLTKPHNTFGFFRESLQENAKGAQMIEVDFIGYLDEKSSETKIMSARRTENLSELNLKTTGGVLAVVEKGDFVRRKAYFLNPENVENYKFVYEGENRYQSHKIYKISFYPKDENDLRYIRRGEIYITKGALAFAEINYRFDKNKLESRNNNIETSFENREDGKDDDVLIIMTGVNNTIRYRLYNDSQWVLSSVEARSNLSSNYKGVDYLYTIFGKLVINNIKTDGVVKIKTNYNVDADFSKAVKKHSKSKAWDDNYKLSLSDSEKQILKDISENN